MAIWPTADDFPQKPQGEGFNQTWKQNVSRFEPTQGPTKTRQIATTSVQTYNWLFILESFNHRTIFETFYEGDLQFGNVVIDLNHPLIATPTLRQWKMLDEPVITSREGSSFNLRFKVELQP